MRTGFPCNESRFFPVGIDLQGKAVLAVQGLGLQCGYCQYNVNFIENCEMYVLFVG